MIEMCIYYRSVKEDFRGKEGVILTKVSVIENEEELHSVVECLDGMRNTTKDKISAQ
jgi:hypothetical protein